MAKTISVSEARDELGDTVDRVARNGLGGHFKTGAVSSGQRDGPARCGHLKGGGECSTS